MTEPINPEGTTPSEPPYVPPIAQPAYAGTGMPDIADIVEGSKGRKDSSGSSLGRNVVVGAVAAAVVIAGGAFFAGRAMAAGPATLADAVQQAQAGSLPCGTSSTGAGAFIGRLCGTGTGAQGGFGGGLPGGATGQGGAVGGFGGRGLAGTVTAVTPTSITLDTRAGSVTVAVPATAAVSKTVAGALTDVTVGSTVTVTSTTDANGARTASRITLVPAGTPLPTPNHGSAATPSRPRTKRRPARSP